MVYKFALISDEADDFLREIQIDADATFYDLHKVILESCDYADDQMTSFFLCNDEWEKQQEITLEDMHNTGVDEDSYVMRDTRLSELLEDEKQRLIYVFDPLAERVFFLELTHINAGTQPQPECTRKKGKAPKQTTDFNEFVSQQTKTDTPDLDEDFFGNETFNEDDLDTEGLDISEGNPYEE